MNNLAKSVTIIMFLVCFKYNTFKSKRIEFREVGFWVYDCLVGADAGFFLCGSKDKSGIR